METFPRTASLARHTGFPFGPFLNVQLPVAGDRNTCNLVYTDSFFCQVTVAGDKGGAGNSYSNPRSSDQMEISRDRQPRLRTRLPEIILISPGRRPRLPGSHPPPEFSATISADRTIATSTSRWAWNSCCARCQPWGKTRKLPSTPTSITCMRSLRRPTPSAKPGRKQEAARARASFMRLQHGQGPESGPTAYGEAHNPDPARLATSAPQP